MTEETKTEKDIQELIDLAFSAVVQTSVELEDDQLDALENLNQYCVNAALHNPEVIKKPLKVVYKTNEGLKEALVAICLAYSLVNPRRKLRENKEFFDKNITITSAPATSSSSISEKLRRTAYRRPFTGTSSKTGSFTSTGNAAELRRWWTKRPIWRGWTTTSAAAIRCTNSPAFTANIRKKRSSRKKKAKFPHRTLSAMPSFSRWQPK